MRLIDADALMESIGCADAVKYGNRDRAQQDISYSTMMLYEIRGEIDAQPTVGGWISVKDRLPDGKDCYLAYNRYGWDIMAYDPNEGVWLSMGHRVADGEITHWMPLPAEPPEEVNEDEDD